MFNQKVSIFSFPLIPFPDLKTIEVLFKMAAIFLQDNFNQHYEPKVLQLGGMPIKNRLQILYDWIVFYQHLFKFGNSHCK